MKNELNSKTDSNHKESTTGEIKKHEEQIAGLIGSLNGYGDSFHVAAQNMATCAEIPVNKINRLLSARTYGTDRAVREKILLYREVSFYDLIQRSIIVTSLKKKKQRKVISALRENRQAL